MNAEPEPVENVTHIPLPGHDDTARVNGAGPHDPFDADAPDTPEREAAETVERLAVVEELLAGHRQVLALVTTATIILALIVAVHVFKGARAA